MSEDTSKRKRYPAKISIVNVTTEMREDLDVELKESTELTEAELVREALREYLNRRKKSRQKKEQP